MKDKPLNPPLLRKSLLPASAAFLLLALLFLAGCSDNNNNRNFNYLRSAVDFSVDTADADLHCEDPGPNFPGEASVAKETCRKTQKFVLRWERPEEIEDFQGYRLYLDTTPGVKSWAAAQGDEREIAVVIPKSGNASEELVFFFYDGDNLPPGIAPSSLPDTLHPGAKRVFGLDTSGRLDTDKDGNSLDRFVFALATRYSGSRAQGQPQFTIIITGDKFPPNIFKPFYKPGARTLEIDWARPTDPTSFFNPGMDTGTIKGYYLTLLVSWSKDLQERNARFNPKIEYRVGGVDRTMDVVDSAVTLKDAAGRRYFLPDFNRARRGSPLPGDSLKVIFSNLTPEDSYDLILYAVDSTDNDNEAAMPKDVTVLLTDTTRPTTPDLEVVDSLTTKNSFVVRWTASRDSLDKGCADGRPNCRIAEYRLSRVPKPGPGEKIDALGRRDTVIAVTQGNAGDSVFQEAVRFLPPGRTYQLRIFAVDTTGYASATDSVEIATDSVLFADSGLACPSGFVPIPAARFRLGDTADAAETDERTGQRMVEMESFCIEPYEHRDSQGGFVTEVTWEEADAVCKSMSPDSGSIRLCSEAQWERACEGFDAGNPHPHGIQSERDPGILQASCNQATGDLAMAMSFDLRNPICLTNEGVYDMAGNLSEWVRDPYNPRAYEMEKDTVLGFDFAFPHDTGIYAGVYSIRGGNYLKPPVLTTNKAQDLARCSNRDYPMQFRPRSRASCVSSDYPMVVATYQADTTSFRCIDIPEPLRNTGITDVVVSPRDSTKLIFFRAGSARIDSMTIPEDSLTRGRKPLSVGFTPLSLAEVVFERVGAPSDTIVDTLETREMYDTSQATLEKILRRESPSEAWAPRKENGRYVVRKMYAHVFGGYKLAKRYYASRNLGFRCCSKPVQKPAPAATAGNP